MKVDYARAKAKRDSCVFYRCGNNNSHRSYINSDCKKIGYRRPFLTTCHSCRYYTPNYTPNISLKEAVPAKTAKRTCTVCGAILKTSNLKIKRCIGRCKNNLIAYFPPKIIIEEIRLEDFYGTSLT